MDDPRLTPARPEVAAKYLEGKVEGRALRRGRGVRGDRGDRAAAPRAGADAEMWTQALKGERVTIYDRNGEGFAWGQLGSDGYVGWLPESALAKPAAIADAQGHRALDAGLSRSLDQAAAGRNAADGRAGRASRAKTDRSR